MPRRPGRPAVFETKLLKLAELLDLDAEPGGEPFLARDRPRTERAEGPLPPEVQKLYEQLLAI